MNINERLRKFRNEKGISTYELSKLTGISQSTISKIENGKRKTDVEILDKIADALKVSIDRLTGESVSSIIEERIEELGITLEQVATKAGVPLYWLQNIDTFIPGEMDDIREPRELEWNDTIGWYKSYDWVTKVAEVIGVHGGTLRAALARQETPVYDGPVSSAEEDFGDVFVDEENDDTNKNKTINIDQSDNEIETLAAHHDGEEFTEDELEDIQNFKKYVLSKRKNKE